MFCNNKVSPTIDFISVSLFEISQLFGYFKFFRPAQTGKKVMKKLKVQYWDLYMQNTLYLDEVDVISSFFEATDVERNPSIFDTQFKLTNCERKRKNINMS